MRIHIVRNRPDDIDPPVQTEGGAVTETPGETQTATTGEGEE